jgi:hypothetical protein
MLAAAGEMEEEAGESNSPPVRRDEGNAAQAVRGQGRASTGVTSVGQEPASPGDSSGSR